MSGAWCSFNVVLECGGNPKGNGIAAREQVLRLVEVGKPREEVMGREWERDGRSLV